MAKMITILGPTACGKTKLAVAIAHKLDGEIIVPIRGRYSGVWIWEQEKIWTTMS